MPEGYTHIRTARRAAEAVRYKIKCPAAFAAGANGPDTFFCFEAWKPARKRLYDLPALGHRLHDEKTGPFLRSMVGHVRTMPQIEYVMGFVCHYATDTVVHPYVEALCRPGMPYAQKGGHGYFEAALDTLLHEQDTGSGMVPAADSAPALTGEALADIANLLHTCLQEVFDLDIPVEYLADSFYHATRLRGLFTSRHGVRRVFYWLVEPLFAGRGYITGHVTPSKMKKLPARWTDPFSGEEHSEDIFTLLEKAQSRSEKFMAATILAWGGQLAGPALAEQLGSMSYLEGRPTAKSDPDFTPPEPKTEPAAEPEPVSEAKPTEEAPVPESAGAVPSGGPEEEKEPAEGTAAEPAEAAPSDAPQEKAEPAAEPAEPVEGPVGAAPRGGPQEGEELTEETAAPEPAAPAPTSAPEEALPEGPDPSPTTVLDALKNAAPEPPQDAETPAAELPAPITEVLRDSAPDESAPEPEKQEGEPQ